MITYSGLKEVNEQEASLIQELALKHCNKIIRKVPNATFHLSCKCNHKGEKNHYHFICRIETPNARWSVEAEDWDLRKALHETLINAEKKVQHSFHLEGKQKTPRKNA